MGYIEEENRILRDGLNKAKKKLVEQDEVLKQLLEMPTIQGTVVSVRGTKVFVSTANGLVEVAFPRQPVDGKYLDMQMKPGVIVRLLSGPAPGIVDVIGLSDSFGDLAVVSKEAKNGECEIEWNGSTRIVRVGAGLKNPEPGDRLMMDEKVVVAIKNLGPDESKFSFQGTDPTTWNDIGGLEGAKQTLIEAIELPHLYPDLFKMYNKKQTKGVLLYGPPGCGKTMLGKATANSLAKSHGKDAVISGFIYVKGPEILDKYVGNSEAKIRGLFARARKHQKKFGYPAVLFIDEADAILSKRDGRPGMGIEATTVPQFLAEMDGLDTTGPIVLLATNRPDSLDSAVTRDGRVDQKVQVTRPDQHGAMEIFKLFLKNVPLAKGLNVDDAAAKASALMYDDKFLFYNLFGKNGTKATFTLAGLANGAMVAGIVEKAAMYALNRDIANLKAKKQVGQGVTLNDIQVAIEVTYNQNKHLNHEMEVQEFVETNQLTVDQVIPARAA